MPKPTSYKDILAGVIAARGWLESLDIPTAGTRLGTIQDVVGRLVHQGVKEALEAYRFSRTSHALCDGYAFMQIHRAFQDLKSHELPRESLRRCLSGPLSPEDERLGSPNTDPRNVAAELELAADLRLRDLDVTGFDDVIFRFSGETFQIQVKRPGSERSVATNLERAREQLRMKLDSRQKGLVAVHLDRVLGLHSEATIVDDERGLLAKVRRLSHEFCDRYRSEALLFLDPRVLGFVLIFRMLVLTRPSYEVGPGYYLAVVPLGSDRSLESSKFDLLQRLAARLET